MERDAIETSRTRLPLLLLHRDRRRRRPAWDDCSYHVLRDSTTSRSKLMGGARRSAFQRWRHRQAAGRSEARFRSQNERSFCHSMVCSMLTRRWSCVSSCERQDPSPGRRVVRTRAQLLPCAQGTSTHLACGSMRVKSCWCRCERQCAVGRRS